jgi:hypothetical protein
MAHCRIQEKFEWFSLISSNQLGRFENVFTSLSQAWITTQAKIGTKAQADASAATWEAIVRELLGKIPTHDPSVTCLSL